jgi:hypothetical protein
VTDPKIREGEDPPHKGKEMEFKWKSSNLGCKSWVLRTDVNAGGKGGGSSKSATDYCKRWYFGVDKTKKRDYL